MRKRMQSRMQLVGKYLGTFGSKKGNDWDLGDIMGEQKGNHKQIETYSEAYKKRKLKLLGHAIRADNADLMRQVAFMQGSVNDKQVGKRRVGEPRLDWVQERKNAWKTSTGEIDQADRRTPDETRRIHKAKFNQETNIMEARSSRMT